MVFSKFPVIQRNLPVINLVIASSALGFQICVLYPWHLVIDKSHKDLILKMEEQEKRINNINSTSSNFILPTSSSSSPSPSK